MSLTAAVEKDGFSYAGDYFYAEASGHHRHRRATIPELRELFHPTAAAATPAKDPAGHWYEAQCLHYGLPPSKTKSVAKMRLLDALNKGLTVPQTLQTLEKELNKQWNKNERQARSDLKKDAASKPKEVPKNADKKGKKPQVAAVEKEATTKESKKPKGPKEPKEPKEPKGAKTAKATNKAGEKAAPGRKRKLEDAKPGTQADSKAKKPKAATSKASTSANSKAAVTTSSPATTTAQRAKQTARRGGLSGSKASARATPTAAGSSATTPAPRSKQTAKRGGLSGSKASTQPTPATTGSPAPKRPYPKQTARRGGGYYPARPEYPRANSGNEITGWDIKSEEEFDSYSFDTNEEDPGSEDYQEGYREDYREDHREDSQEDYSGVDTYSDVSMVDPFPSDGESEEIDLSQRRLGLINGRYRISCPSLQNEWSQYENHTFSLILTLQGETIWGAYDFGMFNGVIFFPQRPWDPSDEELNFNWRGVENSEGVISYDDSDQNGWIRFLGEGQIRGNIRGLFHENTYFEGQRTSGSNTRSERDARSLMEEWDSYSSEAYERARVGRWG